MVPAVVGAYQCNGTVDWLEEEHPYYPPTVNDPGAAEFAKAVIGQLLGTSNVSVRSQLARLRVVHNGSGCRGERARVGQAGRMLTEST